jgi:uncharacterized protein
VVERCAPIRAGARQVTEATMHTNMQPAAAPTQPIQRIQILDILRGFAIFGILLVNMAFFNHAIYALALNLSDPVGTLDQLARWGITFFAEGKFYSIFAFLFGLGLAIQYRRAREQGHGFVPFFLRRMGILLGIGLIHAYLFWVGDILILYAVLGVTSLLLFRNCRPKTLLIWSGVLLVIPLLINAALFALIWLARSAPDSAGFVDTALAEQQRSYQTLSTQADQVYASGTFAEITRQRVQDMTFIYFTWPFTAFNILAMIILGLYAGARRIFDDIPGHLPFIRRLWRWGLIVGVIGNLIYVIAGQAANRSVPSPQLLVALVGQTFGAPALALFYMTSLLLLTQTPIWERRLRPLASVGRMAISNYLLQTIICTTLFYGYGFGFYGRIGAASGVLLTIAIYALQIPVSVWWLRHFRFGPVEWLWRSLTYGKRQPMRYPPGDPTNRSRPASLGSQP